MCFKYHLKKNNFFSGKIALVIPLPAAPEGFFHDGWTQMDEAHLVRPTTRLVDYHNIYFLFFHILIIEHA